MKKSKASIKREKIAREMTLKLLGTGLHVSDGGPRIGPFVLSVHYLSREQIDKIVEVILAVRPRHADSPFDQAEIDRIVSHIGSDD